MGTPFVFDELAATQWVDTVIAALYQAAAGRVDWSEPLGSLGREVDACAVAIVAVRADGAASWSGAWTNGATYAPLAALPVWQASYPGCDRVLAMPVGGWFNDRDLFSAGFVAGNTFYQASVLAHGGRWIAVLKVSAQRDSAVLLVLVRALGRNSFDRDDLSVVDPLRSHLARAVDFGGQVLDAEALPVRGQQLVDCFGRPMAMVDDECRLVRANAAARRFFDTGDPAWIRDGRVALRRDEDDRRLRQAVQRSPTAMSGITDARRIVNCRRAGDGSIVAVLVMTVGPEVPMRGFGDRLSAVLAFIDPFAARPIDAELVSHTFNLTPSESRVAIQLAQGVRLDGIAKNNGVAVATVRTQLKSLFAKTGTNRQTDLVRLVSGLPEICSSQRSLEPGDMGWLRRFPPDR